MKRLIAVLIVLTIVLVSASAAGTRDVSHLIPVESAGFEDGIYFAQEPGFAERSGWKYVVTLEVAGGRIVSADWNGAHRNAGLDKKTLDKMGGYQMVARGGAIDEWYVQAQRVEQKLIETQDLASLPYDEGGYTDAVSGVTIHINEFVDLAAEALAQGPVGRGPHADGSYFAQDLQFPERGSWKSTVRLTVINGYIVAANWSGVNPQGDDKKTVDRAGGYQMVARGGAIDEWYVQAGRVEAHLLETQDPRIPYDEGGYTDAVSGVTIYINDFVRLVHKALEKGPVGAPPYVDGRYTAQEADFNERTGWKSTIEILVSGGFIVDVNWSAIHRDGRDKKTVDRAGEYQMVARGGAIDEWYVQAGRVEAHLLETQNPHIPHDEGGYTDAISGVTIYIDDFVKLADKALEGARR